MADAPKNVVEKTKKRTTKKQYKGVGEETNKKKDVNENQVSFFSVLKILVGSISIFTALSYLLGRLYVEAYYYALGITPSVLSFTANDYIFSSFNLVIMCLVITGCFYFYWWLTKSQKRIEIITKKANTKFLLKVFGVVFLIDVIILVTSLHFSFLYSSGISAITFGILYGIIPTFSVLFFLYFQNIRSSSQKKRKIAFIKLTPIFTIPFAILLIMVSLPAITNGLAVTQAEKDIESFSRVNIIINDLLSTQSLDFSRSSGGIIEGKMIITNKGMTYVLKSENVTSKWQVYAIPVDIVKEIKYFHEEKKKSWWDFSSY